MTDIEKLNKDINDKLKSIVDEIEEKYNCEKGHSIKIGYIFTDNKKYDLFLQFGYRKYFYILDTTINRNSYSIDDIYLYDFELLPAVDLCKEIKNLIKNIDKNLNDNIKNKEKFLKLINK